MKEIAATHTWSHTIILLYKYTRIDDPVAFRDVQRKLCTELGLKGRLLIAHEGINITLEGITENVEKYVEILLADPRFATTHIKRSEGTGSAFPKLIVKVRKEIVTLGLTAQATTVDIDPNVTTGKHLPPAELKQWFDQGKDFVIVDMRNSYEHMSGHFKDSILPPLENFRDLPKVLPQLEPLKNKTVLTVCTGGVRCEKASGYLISQGFNDVYQLDGGIVSYMEQFKDNQEFKGSLYVFDDRKTMAFVDPSVRGVVGKCKTCSAASERYVNCANLACHIHLIICTECAPITDSAFCSDACYTVHTRNRAVTTS